MTTRTGMTAADLFVLLDKEFRRRRPKSCDMCFVQLPYRVDSHDERTANWETVMPPACAHGCAMVLEELVLELQGRYRLEQQSGVDAD